MNHYFLILLVVLIGFSACQSEPEKKGVVEKQSANQIKNSDANLSTSDNSSVSETSSEKELITKRTIDQTNEVKKEIKVEQPRAKPQPKKPASIPKKKKADNDEKLSAKLVSNSKTASKKKTEKKEPLPELVFDYKTYDFGVVDHGDTVSHKFYFVNNGDAPAIISEASSSCGCTVPEYPKKPIKPGQRAFIQAVFATKGKLNTQKKSITIKANTEPNYTTLYLTGEVYNRPKKKELVDSVKLDSIKKATKKAERDSLKLKKKADKKQHALKNNTKNNKETSNNKQKENATKENKTDAKESTKKSAKDGEIDYFLPVPKPKKPIDTDKKEKP